MPIDAGSFPTIIDEILVHTSRATLRTVRLVSRELKARADRLLAEHVVLSLGRMADDAVGVAPFGLGPPVAWLPETLRAHADAPASYAPPDAGAGEMVARARVVDMTWGPDTVRRLASFPSPSPWTGWGAH